MFKESLLLIPGSASDASVWQHQQQALSKIVDITIPDLTGVNTIESMIDNAIRNMPNEFLLAGHSLGGWLCLEILKRHPTRVKKLCLLATSAEIDSVEVLNKRKQNIDNAKKGKFNQIANEMANIFTYNKSILLSVMNMFKRNKELFISQQQALITRKSNLEWISSISQPTLIIAAEKDNIYFTTTKTIADNIPHSQFKIIKDCGHMLTLEAPDTVTELMLNWIHD